MTHTIAEFHVDCEFLNCLINFQITKYNNFYYKIINLWIRMYNYVQLLLSVYIII